MPGPLELDQLVGLTPCPGTEMTNSIKAVRDTTAQRAFLTAAAALLASLTMLAPSNAALATADPGKKACAAEAKTLCPAEMKTFSRKKVEACMIVKIDQTSPICHAAMLRIKAQRGV